MLRWTVLQHANVNNRNTWLTTTLETGEQKITLLKYCHIVCIYKWSFRVLTWGKSCKMVHFHETWEQLLPGDFPPYLNRHLHTLKWRHLSQVQFCTKNKKVYSMYSQFHVCAHTEHITWFRNFKMRAELHCSLKRLSIMTLGVNFLRGNFVYATKRQKPIPMHKTKLEAKVNHINAGNFHKKRAFQLSNAICNLMCQTLAQQESILEMQFWYKQAPPCKIRIDVFWPEVVTSNNRTIKIAGKLTAHSSLLQQGAILKQM